MRLAKNRLKYSRKRKATPKPPEKNSLEIFFDNLTKNHRKSNTAKETETESFKFAFLQYLQNFQPSQLTQDTSNSTRRNSDPLIKLDLQINGKSVDPVKIIQEKSDELINTMKKQNLDDFVTKLRNNFNQNLNTEDICDEDHEMDDPEMLKK
ncbi:hypothetical protein Avbf_12760 [Armadillidium vulgare]|nr:hypothetical protein Avbf_12760 [Armadillidium vulgare]